MHLDGVSRLTRAEDLHLEIDDFTDPWNAAATVLMIHGLAESGEAFRGWVPHLSRDFKVVRMDLRGFGRSRPVSADFPWSVDQIVGNIDATLDRLGVERAHLVGAKIGGTFAMLYAAARPSRVRSLVLASAPVSLRGLREQVAGWRSKIARDGVKKWAGDTMRTRMGSQMGDAALAWWTELMGRTDPDTLEGFLQMVPTVDAWDALPHIRVPVLVIASAESPLEPISVVREWTAQLSDSCLEVLQGDSYHVSAAEPDRCATIAHRFLHNLNWVES